MEKKKSTKRTVLWKVIPGFVIVLLIGCIVYLCAVVKSNTAARMDSMRYRILFDRECTGSEIVKAAEEARPLRRLLPRTALLCLKT